MPEPLIECVPNFSEGRRPEIIERIAVAIRAVEGVRLLDTTMDADHNRAVITFAGSPTGVVEAAFQGAAIAATLIDLDIHRGAHPRIGATDVIPFVPIRDATLADCAELARRLGRRLGEELRLPVYLYEAAATRPDRRNLADVRRGEYEGLKESLGHDPDRKPDFGPEEIGPAGAVAVGARPPLIAYNIYLSTGDVEVAQRVARAIRASSGGLRSCKALGLLVGGRAQVSINMTNFRDTPLHRVWELVRAEAARYGVLPTESEVIGLLPEDALLAAAEHYLQLNHFRRDQILERRLAARGEQPDAGPGMV
jgi:glutamate formiminotransferase